MEFEIRCYMIARAASTSCARSSIVHSMILEIPKFYIPCTSTSCCSVDCRSATTRPQIILVLVIVHSSQLTHIWINFCTRFVVWRHRPAISVACSIMAGWLFKELWLSVILRHGSESAKMLIMNAVVAEDIRKRVALRSTRIPRRKSEQV